jgi:hypothetical protein
MLIADKLEFGFKLHAGTIVKRNGVELAVDRVGCPGCLAARRLQ